MGGKRRGDRKKGKWGPKMLGMEVALGREKTIKEIMEKEEEIAQGTQE